MLPFQDNHYGSVFVRPTPTFGPLDMRDIVQKVSEAVTMNAVMNAVPHDRDTLFFFSFSSLISIIADGPHHYRLTCGHKGSSHLSPVHALQFFIAIKV